MSTSANKSSYIPSQSKNFTKLTYLGNIIGYNNMTEGRITGILSYSSLLVGSPPFMVGNLKCRKSRLSTYLK